MSGYYILEIGYQSIPVVLKPFRLGTPQIILFEVGTPLYLFDSIPQRNNVKIADLKALCAFRSASYFLACRKCNVLNRFVCLFLLLLLNALSIQ